ncbi:hypothetical protein KC887_00445 [Candidatus Kaiserbacteria bacterium]|nr:hypothetical protein [Candidatus Kaiserbacteria bacterium]
MNFLRDRGILDGNRYGVQAVHRKLPDGVNIQVPGCAPGMFLTAMPSLPDFEGVIPGARQFTFDCKVCSDNSLSMSEYFSTESSKGKRVRQMRHLVRRANMGCCSGLLIHFNERVLKTRVCPAVTYFWQVGSGVLWNSVVEKQTNSVSRFDCELHAVKVFWTKGDGESIYRPDFASFVFDFFQTKDMEGH